MQVSDFPFAVFDHQVTSSGVSLQIGPYSVRLNSNISDVVKTVYRLYADYPVNDTLDVNDFHVSVERPRTLRRWYHPQVQFYLDGHAPFKPLPLAQAFPFFEWGLNWCIASYSNQYLILHAAVVEKQGKAIILPAPPGSGKSTLCAGLVARGWRLLSDELAMLSLDDLGLTPVPRPISLKNESIDVMAQFAPELMIGPRCADTAKGTVAHVRPPGQAVAHAGERVMPLAVVLPRYLPGSETRLEPITRGRLMMQLVSNTFNYNVHGPTGFECLADLLERCQCLQFRYSRLEEAVTAFDALVGEP